MRNIERKLIGRLDGVQTNHGELIPIEIKSHLRRKRSDLLELAFYWLLLEPYRTRPAARRGIVLLIGETKELEIPDIAFERVERLIEQVRDARRNGVAPTYCRCEVCVTRPEVAALAKSPDTLHNILGIQHSRSETLEDAGIRTHGQLLACAPEQLRAVLKATGGRAGLRQIGEWQCHALAYQRNDVVCFRDVPFAARDFIAIDFEYVSGSHIWLIGCAINIGKSQRIEQFWADTRPERQRALRALDALLKEYPDLPVLTWSGLSAEVPHLKRATKTLRMPKMAERFISRHVDLCDIIKQSLRIPVPNLRIGTIADYVGFRGKSQIEGGWEAGYLYYTYREADGSTREAIKNDLLIYNRDDIQALSVIARTLFREPRSCDFPIAEAPARKPSPPKRLREPERLSGYSPISGRRHES